MAITVDVSISDDLMLEAGISEIPESGDENVPDPALLQQWATAAYLGHAPAIASMRVTTANEIQQLNKQYRDKDTATNVLSFAMQSPAEVDITLLGDIVLCSAVIKQEAKQQCKSEKSHWAHMVVHGMLHLQGYDHLENDEAEEMERLEIKILEQLEFANPYK